MSTTHHIDLEPRSWPDPITCDFNTVDIEWTNIEEINKNILAKIVTNN